MTKVLIIEDDELLSDIYATKLQLEGFTVDTAQHGVEGMAKAATNPPHVILLDMIMPYMNGIEFLAAYAAGHSQKAIILIMSNKSASDDIHSALRLGATDYLIKAHYTPDQIVAKIRTHLEPLR